MTFLLAKQRTLHVFSDSGRSIPVSLCELDSGVVVLESAEPIPVGVFVEWPDQPEPRLGQVLNCRPATGPSADLNLLAISVEFRPNTTS